MKKRWIALAVIVVVALMTVSFFAGAYVNFKSDNKPVEILEAVSIDIRPKPLDAMKIEELVNQERIKAGLQPLAHNEKLKQSACMKLDDMVAKNYWAHVSPDGTEPWYFFRQADYRYVNAGENLAYGYNIDDDLLSGWMNSPTHKSNILGSFSEQAICTKSAKYKNGYYNLTVNHFGTPY